MFDNGRKKEATPGLTCLTIKTRKYGSILKNFHKTLEGMTESLILLNRFVLSFYDLALDKVSVLLDIRT